MLFLRYLRQRLPLYGAFAGFCAIFAVCIRLYRLPLPAVLYPTALCLLLGAVLTVADFLRVKERHRVLDSITALTGAIADALPPAESIESRDLQRIIALMEEEHRSHLALTDRKYNDMVDYYTVWAHQIKTPIASMRLHLQNEDSDLSRRLSADLNRVEQYVEMVMTFLRLDSGSTDYLIREYDLDPIIRQAVKKFSREFISRRLSLVYEPVNARVLTDEKWLSFVLEQVLSNALKYTPSGTVTIAWEPGERLTVRDTGMGIAPEDLPRIFENGYTGYNGRVDKKASGIGLYLCRRICRNLGHDITASSVPDRGTVITLDLSRRKIYPE